MLSTAVSLLSIGLWLGYLTIAARVTPARQAIAQRSARRR
jgi:hypothetical protein